MTARSFLALGFAGLISGVFPTTGSAQSWLPDLRFGGFESLVTLSGPAEDALRIRQLLGGETTPGDLIRSPSSLTPEGGRLLTGFHWEVLLPEVNSSWNSEIPSLQNDGTTWAGRGYNAQVVAGLKMTFGPVKARLAPQLVFIENLYFPVVPNLEGELSAYAYPWDIVGQQMDLPVRHGNGDLTILDPGQSMISVNAGPISLGASTENQWWGPGIRNSIILSNSAPGIPHLFLGSSEPLKLPFGELEMKWMSGVLVESLYFDSIAANDQRAMSGAVISFQPSGEPDLTLGAARVVYSNAAKGSLLDHAPDVFLRWQTGSVADSLSTPEEAEQISSLFARWAFPLQGFEAYGEWSRSELPHSLRDFLVAPNHAQGYTLGLQWARRARQGAVRIQAEATYLEKSATVKQREVGTFYMSRGVPQGYTHRGQSIGAAIGPGSSSQWLAGDYITDRWDAGAYISRVRWQSDVLYATESPAPGRPIRSPHAFDVSLTAGVRGGYRVGPMRIGGEMALEHRLNFLFQNPDLDYTSPGAVDFRNLTARLSFSPVPRRRVDQPR